MRIVNSRRLPSDGRGWECDSPRADHFIELKFRASRSPSESGLVEIQREENSPRKGKVVDVISTGSTILLGYGVATNTRGFDP